MFLARCLRRCTISFRVHLSMDLWHPWTYWSIRIMCFVWCRLHCITIHNHFHLYHDDKGHLTPNWYLVNEWFDAYVQNEENMNSHLGSLNLYYSITLYTLNNISVLKQLLNLTHLNWIPGRQCSCQRVAWDHMQKYLMNKTALTQQETSWVNGRLMHSYIPSKCNLPSYCNNSLLSYCCYYYERAHFIQKSNTTCFFKAIQDTTKKHECTKKTKVQIYYCHLTWPNSQEHREHLVNTETCLWHLICWWCCTFIKRWLPLHLDHKKGRKLVQQQRHCASHETANNKLTHAKLES